MLTLTITGALVEASRGLNDPVMLRRVLSVLAFLLGVLAGGLLVRHVSVSASLGLGLAIIVGACSCRNGGSARSIHPLHPHRKRLTNRHTGSLPVPGHQRREF